MPTTQSGGVRLPSGDGASARSATRHSARRTYDYDGHAARFTRSGNSSCVTSSVCSGTARLLSSSS